MSGRAQIVMSPDEQLELLADARVVVVSTNGRRGWPHSMPMWFTLRRPGGDVPAGGAPREIWIWTYAKSQKVRNLERDSRATLLVETGKEYMQLRGVQIEAQAEVIRDPARVLDFGRELVARYAGGDGDDGGDEAVAALEAQAAKRVAIRFEAKRVASWDHRKLEAAYRTGTRAK